MLRITGVVLLLFSIASCPAQLNADSARIAELMTILRERHFAPRTIDDRFSADVFDSYLRTLDPDTLYLSLQERDGLASDRLHIDDQLAHGAPSFVHRCDSLMQAGLLRALALVDGDGTSTAHAEPQRRWQRRLAERSAEVRAATGGSEEEAMALVQARARNDLRARIERGREERMDLFLGTLANVHDAQSTYLSAKERSGFDHAMTQSFVGIGVTLTSTDGRIRIGSMEPGGPAALGGTLAVGDELLTVRELNAAPVPVTGLSIDATVELLRGPAGSTLELIVRQADGGQRTVVLERALIHPAAGRARACVVRDAGAPIGVITLPRFYTDLSGGSGPRCSLDVAELLDSLLNAGIAGLAIDLRDNQGGSMSETIHILGLFLDAAPVAQRLARDGTLRVLSTTAERARYRGPIVVLVNERSASASEFFAAALQDHKRAVVMGGPRTYGKGTIQNIVDLTPISVADGTSTSAGSAKITVGLFFRPSGGSVQLEGVVPDIVLESGPSSGPTGERALPFAMKHDGIAACPITPWYPAGAWPVEAIQRARDRKAAGVIPGRVSTVRTTWYNVPDPAPIDTDDAGLGHAILLLQDAAGPAASQHR